MDTGPTTKGLRPGEVHLIANRLRRYFAPASVLQPPRSSRTFTGNRNVAISAGSSPNNAPDDSGVAQLQNGVAVVQFKTGFKNTPTIIVSPVGQAADMGEHEIYVDALGYRNGTAPPQGTVIKSTYASDDRYVFWHAVGNPD